jgi:alpha-tubulin suppressor-like RCC1 family protein
VPVAVDTSGVLNGKFITQISAELGAGMALDSNGKVYTWGINIDGGLGNGNNIGTNVPVSVITSGVLNGKIITQISGGGFYAMALSSDGKVYTWGDNSFGQLGIGNNINSNVPVGPVAGLLAGNIIKNIDAGGFTSLAV